MPKEKKPAAELVTLTLKSGKVIELTKEEYTELKDTIGVVKVEERVVIVNPVTIPINTPIQPVNPAPQWPGKPWGDPIWYCTSQSPSSTSVYETTQYLT